MRIHFYQLNVEQNASREESPLCSTEHSRLQEIAQRVGETLLEHDPGSQLLTAQLLQALIANREAEFEHNPTFLTKFFTAWDGEQFFVCSYEPLTGEFYGLRGIVEAHWGFFSLKELMQLRGPFEMKIERSIQFQPTIASDVVGSN